jgi:hypothetical protein
MVSSYCWHLTKFNVIFFNYIKSKHDQFKKNFKWGWVIETRETYSVRGLMNLNHFFIFFQYQSMFFSTLHWWSHNHLQWLSRKSLLSYSNSFILSMVKLFHVHVRQAQYLIKISFRIQLYFILFVRVFSLVNNGFKHCISQTQVYIQYRIFEKRVCLR